MVSPAIPKCTKLCYKRVITSRGLSKFFDLFEWKIKSVFTALSKVALCKSDKRFTRELFPLHTLVNCVMLHRSQIGNKLIQLLDCEEMGMFHSPLPCSLSRIFYGTKHYTVHGKHGWSTASAPYVYFKSNFNKELKLLWRLKGRNFVFRPLRSAAALLSHFRTYCGLPVKKIAHPSSTARGKFAKMCKYPYHEC